MMRMKKMEIRKRSENGSGKSQKEIKKGTLLSVSY